MGHPFWEAAQKSVSEKNAINPWGGITATLDWCEENLFYPVYFIAEFWNTISNVGMIVLGLYGAYRTMVIHNLPLKYVLGYLCITLVGIGSACFHGTLLFTSQLLDELPMILADGVFLYLVAPKRWKTQQNYIFLALAILAYVLFVTVVYVYTRNAIFFESMYALGAILITARCVAWHRKYGSVKKHDAARDTIVWGTFCFGLAFFLWNIDNTFCEKLREIRKTLYFISPLFQFHAIWHLGTGLGTYCLAVFCTYVEQEDEENQKSPNTVDRTIKWKFGILPVLDMKGTE